MTNIFFSTGDELFAFRVAVSLLCGTVIGIERQWRGRQAGLRTNLLVCVGATIFTYLSATAFGGDAGHSAVAAQIVSGIGFLGAGVVLRRGESVQGLNTAATLWTAAAIGMAAGIGATGVALIATGAILVVQLLFRPLAGFVDRYTQNGVPRFRYWLTVTVEVAAAREVQDIILSTLQDRPVSRPSAQITIGPDDTAALEFVFGCPGSEVGTLELLFADLTRLAGMRDISWRSEVEKQGIGRRRVTQRGMAHTQKQGV